MSRGQLVAIKGRNLDELEACLDMASGVLPMRCEKCGGPAEDGETIRRWGYAVGKNYQAVRREREKLDARCQAMYRNNPTFRQCLGEQDRIRAEAAKNEDGQVPFRNLDDGTREIIVPEEKQEQVAKQIRAMWSKPENAKARKMYDEDDRKVERELDKPVRVAFHTFPWHQVPRGMKGTYLSFLASYMIEEIPGDLEAVTAANEQAAASLGQGERGPGLIRRLFGWIRPLEKKQPAVVIPIETVREKSLQELAEGQETGK